MMFTNEHPGTQEPADDVEIHFEYVNNETIAKLITDQLNTTHNKSIAWEVVEDYLAECMGLSIARVDQKYKELTDDEKSKVRKILNQLKTFIDGFLSSNNVAQKV